MLLYLTIIIGIMCVCSMIEDVVKTICNYLASTYGPSDGEESEEK